MTEDVENSKIAERNRGVMSYQEIVDAWHRDRFPTGWEAAASAADW